MKAELILAILSAFMGLLNTILIVVLYNRNPKREITRVSYQDGGMAWADKDGYIINSTTKPENTKK